MSNNYNKEGFLGSINIGSTLKIYEKVREALDKRGSAGHNIRVNLGSKIVEVTPNFENENIGVGTATGAILAVAARQANALVPVPILADTEIAAAEPVEGGTRYTVNVDAALEQQARFQALMEAGEGAVSFVADEIDLEKPQPLRKRLARTTWQYEVFVRETAESSEGTFIGGLNLAKDPKDE